MGGSASCLELEAEPPVGVTGQRPVTSNESSLSGVEGNGPLQKNYSRPRLRLFFSSQAPPGDGLWEALPPTPSRRQKPSSRRYWPEASNENGAETYSRPRQLSSQALPGDGPWEALPPTPSRGPVTRIVKVRETQKLMRSPVNPTPEHQSEATAANGMIQRETIAPLKAIPSLQAG